jgi:heat shock protein HslJ
MKRKTRLTSVPLSFYLIMSLLLAACRPATRSDTAQPSVPLEGTEWLLVSIEGQAPAEGSKPELSFHAEDYVQGSTGCNTFGTNYTVHEDDFRLDEVRHTSFDCETPRLREQDEVLLAALARIASYRAADERLTFDDASGATLLVYGRKRSPAVDPALQDTMWVLRELRGQPLVTDSYIQLNLGPEEFKGYAGCNHFGGEYEAASEGILELGQFAITVMDCQSPEGVMVQEQAFVQALSDAASYRLDGDCLEIQDAAGETILTFVRQELGSSDAAQLAGTAWRLVDLDGREPLTGSAVTLAFHQGQRASGFGGCRDYVMRYEVDGPELDFTFTAMPGPGCPDEARMEQEGTFTTMVGWATRIRLEGERLELLTVRGETLSFEPLPQEEVPDLQDKRWMLLAFVEPSEAGLSLPREILPDTEIWAEFEAGAIRGSGGCNDYGASYTGDGSSLAVTEVIRTERACLEPAGIMEQEQRYFDYLADVASAQIYGDQLWLEAEDGRVLVLVPSER